METGDTDTKTEQSFADLDTKNSFTYKTYALCTVIESRQTQQTALRQMVTGQSYYNALCI